MMHINNKSFPLGDIAEICSDGIKLHIKAQPNARKTEFGEILNLPDGKIVLKIRINAVPDKGKANKAIIKYLAKSWKLPKKSIKIISGETSRLKTIKISGNPEELAALHLQAL